MQTTSSVTQQVFSLINVTESIAGNVVRVKRLYEVTKIPNQVADGSEAFPEDRQSLDMGISVEFRYFKLKVFIALSYFLLGVYHSDIQGTSPMLCVIPLFGFCRGNYVFVSALLGHP